MKAQNVRPWSACAFAALLLTTLSLPAPIFIKFDGVDGESTAPGKTNCIDLISFSVGHSRSIIASPPILKDAVITKTLDKSSPKLAEYCASGQHIPQGIITCRKAGGSTNDYYTVTFQDCFITSYQISGSGGGGGGANDSLPTESISFNYAQIEWKYQKQDPAGQPVEPPVIGRWPPGGPGGP